MYVSQRHNSSLRTAYCYSSTLTPVLDNRKGWAKGDSLLFPIMANPMAAPFSEQFVLLFHGRGLGGGWVGGRKQKRSQVVLKWFFHPGLWSHLHIFINVKLFPRLSQNDRSPEASARAVSASWNGEIKLIFKCYKKHCLPTYSDENTQEYVCPSPDEKQLNFWIFIQIFK